MFSTASIQTHSGQRVTMWCSHNIHVSGYLYWFKQSDGAVPVTIVRMLYTESLRKVEPTYFNNFTKDHLVMDLFNKVTTLTITQVKMSDSGFYFCGATGYDMKFGNGTRLEVKANVEEHHNLNTIVNPTMINDLPAVFITEKNYTGTSKKGNTEDRSIKKSLNVKHNSRMTRKMIQYILLCISQTKDPKEQDDIQRTQLLCTMILLEK
ncbi:uncharacterized protein LOC113052528 isoform X3 [Carassius auratus]|uniref:Uncharacterized protein LOC113052528 isoform X3 n=1 Tax=Carassius auratus TaxID=7957 RepID=A0A6P6KKB7_CARAU|nr:uncharacterized protein LOC113052528 isoform X3 [Carassius auratus]